MQYILESTNQTNQKTSNLHYTQRVAGPISAA